MTTSAANDDDDYDAENGAVSDAKKEANLLLLRAQRELTRRPKAEKEGDDAGYESAFDGGVDQGIDVEDGKEFVDDAAGERFDPRVSRFVETLRSMTDAAKDAAPGDQDALSEIETEYYSKIPPPPIPSISLKRVSVQVPSKPGLFPPSPPPLPSDDDIPASTLAPIKPAPPTLGANSTIPSAPTPMEIIKTSGGSTIIKKRKAPSTSPLANHVDVGEEIASMGANNNAGTIGVASTASVISAAITAL